MKNRSQISILKRILFLVLLASYSTGFAQAPFFTETFTDSLASVNKWRHGGTTGGSERWKWRRNATARLFQGQPTFGAKTAATGFMMFDSDANGEFDHDVHLTSPAINCSGQSAVWLRFEAQYAYFNPSSISIVEVGVSTDSINFTYYRVLTNIPRDDVSNAVTPVIVELPPAANQARVFLRFRWRGNYEYVWKVDDIALTASNPTPNYDLVLRDPLIALNFAEPVSQVDTMFAIFAAENRGLLNQANIAAKVDIKSTNGQTATATQTIPSLNKGVTDTVFFENLYLPRDTGVYTYTLSVTGPNPDADTLNNKTTLPFLVTLSTFSKDDDRIVSATQPGDIRGDLWEIGNIYDIAKGGFEAFEAVFSIASNNNAHWGKSVSILLYKITENSDNTFDDNDVEIVGYGFHEFKNEANFARVTTPLLSIANNTQGVKLDADESYLLMIQYTPEMFVPFSPKPYHYNVISTVVKNGGWFLGGFGPEVTALARMRIRKTMVTSVKEPELAENRLSLFPNPADREVHAQINLSAPSKLVEMTIMDISGRTLITKQTDNLQSGDFSFDVSGFAPGTYLMKVRTAEGTRTKRFVVQR
ncbi:MAG: T9SS type A sorting domain-containing protein [Saprospiraceae bacterium]